MSRWQAVSACKLGATRSRRTLAFTGGPWLLTTHNTLRGFSMTYLIKLVDPTNAESDALFAVDDAIRAELDHDLIRLGESGIVTAEEISLADYIATRPQDALLAEALSLRRYRRPLRCLILNPRRVL